MLHPEQMPYEIYMGNSTPDDFKKIGWKTKRWGFVSYDINGIKIPNSESRPVFVKVSEMREAGMEVDPQYILGSKDDGGIMIPPESK